MKQCERTRVTILENYILTVVAASDITFLPQLDALIGNQWWSKWKTSRTYILWFLVVSIQTRYQVHLHAAVADTKQGNEQG